MSTYPPPVFSTPRTKILIAEETLKEDCGIDIRPTGVNRAAAIPSAHISKAGEPYRWVSGTAVFRENPYSSVATTTSTTPQASASDPEATG